jgi:hypothetical protein
MRSPCENRVTAELRDSRTTITIEDFPAAIVLSCRQCCKSRNWIGMKCGYRCRIIINVECNCRINPCPKVNFMSGQNGVGMDNVDRTGR